MYKKHVLEPPVPPPPQDDSDNDSIPPETSPLRKSITAEEQMKTIDEELAALEREEEMLRQAEKQLLPTKNAGEDSDNTASDDSVPGRKKKTKEPRKTMKKSGSSSSITKEAAELKDLINNQEFSDITLCAEGKRMYCHKAILAARCEHFKKLFGMNKAAKEINVKEITNFAVLQALIEYLYTGKASIRDSFVEQLLNIAKDYNLPELIKSCEKKTGANSVDKARSNSVVEIDVAVSYEDIPEETQKMREFRKRIALEVLETETTYVKSLTSIFNDFVVALRAPPEQWDKRQKHLQLLGFSGEDTKNPILTPEEVTAIFSYWEVILRCHATFLKAIEDRMKEWERTPELGDVFLSKTAFIKLYKHYVNNFDKAIMTIKELKEKNKRFKDFLAALEFSPRLSGLGLQAFLILPVQRIPRYVLLLQDLLKHTVAAHPDFNNLHSAQRTMKELADYINAHKNDADEINKILALQDRLINWPVNTSLVQPRRKIVREGTLMMGKDKLAVYLFTDAFLYCKPKPKDKLKYKGLISLPTSSLNSIVKKEDKYDFEIIAQTGKFHFSAAPEERESWIKILNETMEQSQKDLLSTAFSGYEKNDSEGSKQFQQLRVEENLRKRSEVAAQMRDSEKEYLESLDVAMHKFYDPIQHSTTTQYPIASPSEIIALFSTLPQIHKAHTNFLKILDKRVNTWDNNTTIGDLYLELVVDIMKAYSQFFDNYPSAMETLDTAMGNSIHFATFIVTNEKELKVTLTTLLEKPLKRFATYYLSLEEIQQYTIDSHPDLPHLKTVITRLREYLDQQKQNKIETIKAQGGPLLRTRTNSVSKITRKGSWNSSQMATVKSNLAANGVIPKSPEKVTLRSSGRFNSVN